MYPTITDWLTSTFSELSNLGHAQSLTDDQTNWLKDVYTYYQLSPPEAALYFIHELASA